MGFIEDSNLVEVMAKDMLIMEDKYDSSMRGGFLKRLINEYVRLYAERIVNIFDYIYTNQVDDTAYYGDDDVTIRRITIVNNLINKGAKSKVYDRYDYQFRAFLMSDNCGFGGNVVMCEVIRTHKVHKDIIDKYYHIRSVKNSEIDSISLFKMQDVKEETYIVSYVYDICEEWRIERDIPMLDFYCKFKMFVDNIRVTYWQLTNP